MTLNFGSSCLHPLSAGIRGVIQPCTSASIISLFISLKETAWPQQLRVNWTQVSRARAHTHTHFQLQTDTMCRPNTPSHQGAHGNSRGKKQRATWRKATLATLPTLASPLWLQLLWLTGNDFFTYLYWNLSFILTFNPFCPLLSLLGFLLRHDNT